MRLKPDGTLDLDWRKQSSRLWDLTKEERDEELLNSILRNHPGLTREKHRRCWAPSGRRRQGSRRRLALASARKRSSRAIRSARAASRSSSSASRAMPPLVALPDQRQRGRDPVGPRSSCRRRPIRRRPGSRLSRTPPQVPPHRQSHSWRDPYTGKTASSG